MNNKKLVPLDLCHLHEKLLNAHRSLNIYTQSDRSDEFKKKRLENAIDIVDVCIRDIEYLLDEKEI